jgi:hypothetical protein
MHIQNTCYWKSTVFLAKLVHCTVWKTMKFMFVCSFLGYSPESEFYMPTFRNRKCSETSAYKIQTPGNYLPMKMEQTECSETSAYKIQKPGNYLPMKMEQTECSETSAYKIHTPENYPEGNIHHSQHGESLKWRKFMFVSRIRWNRMCVTFRALSSIIMRLEGIY